MTARGPCSSNHPKSRTNSFFHPYRHRLRRYGSTEWTRNSDTSPVLTHLGHAYPTKQSERSRNWYVAAPGTRSVVRFEPNPSLTSVTRYSPGERSAYTAPRGVERTTTLRPPCSNSSAASAIATYRSSLTYPISTRASLNL